MKSYDKTRAESLFANKGPNSQSYGFSSSHFWIWELDRKEIWAPKIWCFWTVVLEKTLESPLDYKEIKPVSSKGNHSWIFIGDTDAEAEAPILWPPDSKSRLTGKDPDAGKDWRQEEKGTTEDEMVGWHHWLSECEFEQAPGNGEGQGSLVCCSPWGRKESVTTEWPNNKRLVFDQTTGHQSPVKLMHKTDHSRHLPATRGFLDPPHRPSTLLWFTPRCLAFLFSDPPNPKGVITSHFPVLYLTIFSGP